jgi:hypothetical protein
MIVLFAAMIVFLFLALGSIAFLACILVPLGRKYALSTALWFAIWGPCCVLFPILALLGTIAGGFGLRATQMRWGDAPRLLSAIGWGSILFGGIITFVVASVAAWFHQALIHRFTFILFRLYATIVIAGIGSVFGWLVVLSTMIYRPFAHALWLTMPLIPTLIDAFGAISYRHAHALRGRAPTRFTWITPDEFAGPVESVN